MRTGLDIEEMQTLTREDIRDFMNGRDAEERIVNVTYSYKDDFVRVYHREESDRKTIRKDPFYPFVWATNAACQEMVQKVGRPKLSNLLREYGISVNKLRTTNVDGVEVQDVKDGYAFLFKATTPMSYGKFLKFFSDCGNPVFAKDGKKSNKRHYLSATPVDQYLISTGKRFFKGMDDYDQLLRLVFKLDTEGRNPKKHRIKSISLRLNRAIDGTDWTFRELIVGGDTDEDKNRSEIDVIDTFLAIISQVQPDIVTSHKGESFDWSFIIDRCRVLGVSMDALSAKHFGGETICKEERSSTLKLGGETDYFYRTNVPGVIVTDSHHAARRARAANSNFKHTSLDYAAKFLRLKDENPGSPAQNTTWACDRVEYTLNNAEFLLNKFLPVTFSRCTTMGTAGQWKALMLAWSYERGLAIPCGKNEKLSVGGISKLLRIGFVKDVLKIDYNSMYVAITLTWGLHSSKDLDNVMLPMLDYILTEREHYKGIRNDARKDKDRFEQQMLSEILSEMDKSDYETSQKTYQDADNLQTVVKMLGNSNFGAISSSNTDVFPWADTEMGCMITCIGRQMLRLMISRFTTLGYKAVVGDTDGFEVKAPQEYRYTDEHPYIGKGDNRNVVEGVAYVGSKADVAEFNDTYLKDYHYSSLGVNKMGVDLEEVAESSVNVSRKNYALYFPTQPSPEDIRLVGNTIKSKSLPGYIEEFLNKGLRFLLRGEGRRFIDYYYDYLSRIYNYQIPLKQIVSKGIINRSIEDYQKALREQTGRAKSRFAWYELCIKNGITPDVGDRVYYINTGTSKGQPDVKTTTRYFCEEDGKKVDITSRIASQYKKYKASFAGKDVLEKEDWIKSELPECHCEDDVTLNCTMVPTEIVKSDEDIRCNEENGIEYNVAKYIEAFNNRIRPLLVCFDKRIRDKILIDNPDYRQYFTEEECTLIYGMPNKPGDQDTYEDLMTMEDKEIKFWISSGHRPPFLEECCMGRWEDIVAEYNKRENREKVLGIDKEREAYQLALSKLNNEERDAFEDFGTIPQSLLEIVLFDKKKNKFVSKRYPDIVIGDAEDVMLNEDSTEEDDV